MTSSTMTAPMADSRVRAGTAALLVLALTCVHHAYGAAAFDTPWRLHIVFVAVPAALVIVAALYAGHALHGTKSGRAATWMAAPVILAFPVATIGFYEGGYNHLFKNVVFFTGGEDAARAIFPSPAYEMPTDFIFEATGIAQFPLSVVTAILTVAMLRVRRVEG